MRKRIIAAIVALSMLLSVFAGCGIITKNEDRDMAQIVAKIGYDYSDSSDADQFVYREFTYNATTKKNEYTKERKALTKRQLRNAYYNVGSNFLQQNMTPAEALDEIVKQLAQREIIIQEAIRSLAEKPYINGYPAVEDCLTDEEIAEAEARAYDEIYKAIKNEFDTIKKDAERDEDEDEDEEEEEEEAHEHRTTQTPVSEDEEKYEQLYTVDDETFADSEEQGYWDRAVRRYNKRLNQSETGLNRDIYYARLLMSEMEQKVVVKYQDKIEDEHIKKILISGDLNCYYQEEGISEAVKRERALNYINQYLQPRYDTAYGEQVETYSNNISGFISALDSYKGDYSLLYSPLDAKSESGYFYVKSLLVGFDDELQELFDEIKNKDLSDSTKKEERAKLLAQITAKDLRDVLEHKTDNVSGEEYDTKAEFPTWLPNQTDKLAELVTDSKLKVDDQYKAVDKPEGDTSIVKKQISNENEFLKWFIDNELKKLAADADFQKSDVYNRAKTSYENAIDTLMFKYNTDTGMFNNDLGYLVKPFKAGQSETYVAEFAYMAREAYKKFMATTGTLEEKQLSSMVIVGTDYGWHIIMVTKVLNAGEIYKLNVDELLGQPIAEDTEVTGYEKSFTYSYSKSYLDEIISDAYSKVSTEIVDRFSNMSDYVTTNNSVYKDLAG